MEKGIEHQGSKLLLLQLLFWRILNRFTKDTETLDNQIGEQLRLFLYISALLIGYMVLCVVYMPWFAIVIPFVVVICIGLVNYYQASAREVKRIEAVKRSFVYNNFNETLGGLNTIKSFGKIKDFLRKNDCFILPGLKRKLLAQARVLGL